ncbi:MAG: hypothetical protein A2667_02660 [Candidatus Wildermuthbacteria bacterium RIFCSPHIGHO2_01_FULL_47_27]|uniref:Uncharacterized protein n=2 Tax=Candidatus Wildermuthiibacteriota TaxID=1817923 RepID=A0A1G2RLN8_9BACT|nr:MAG: hypothetical protein A2667_02660 [Candidatus Wildermuthbacteria bacterium RIFCSPHIGHO2_01_FULL_47_27]OHA68307.1 MAG: hypothetical protein A3D59_04065 [Candidatus Wildermuthbacteria bacterium RIFCSPHIGHO2_02_FULL_47_17]OHA73760.1 MAG: hypothetical protein A3A32_01405 [Candidatus Wildermuthbacteria bacterium RIFCSPLOWO2_01_FULL_48_35]OHA76008.1 MAG: hypothetical protein A3I38_03200 [Candidatus Wildermuthbacteria bacterium RIFCSPLOWO2_02_FULL_47_10]
MRRKKPPKSIRKYIRREKARIRRASLAVEEQKRLINELYSRMDITNLARHKKFLPPKITEKQP